MKLQKNKTDEKKFIHWYSHNARSYHSSIKILLSISFGILILLYVAEILLTAFVFTVSPIVFLVEFVFTIAFIVYGLRECKKDSPLIPAHLLKNYEIKIEEDICTIAEGRSIQDSPNYFSFNIKKIREIKYNNKCKQIEIFGAIKHHRKLYHAFNENLAELSIDLDHMILADIYEQDIVQYLSDKIKKVTVVSENYCQNTFEKLEETIKQKYEAEMDKADIKFSHEGSMNSNFFFRSSISLFVRYMSIFFGALAIIFLAIFPEMSLVFLGIVAASILFGFLYRIAKVIKFSRYQVHGLEVTFNELRDSCTFKYCAHRYIIYFSFALSNIKKTYLHTASKSIRFIVNASIYCEVNPKVKRKDFESPNKEYIGNCVSVTIPDIDAEAMETFLNNFIKPVKRTWVGCNDWFWYSPGLIAKAIFKEPEEPKK